MSVSWIANIVFFGSYFIAWCVKEIPHTTWYNITAIAAIVIVAALVFDNRTVFERRV